MTDTLEHEEPLALPVRSRGRVIRSVLGYALLVALMSFTPVFVFIPAALFACGIRNGKLGVAVSLALATIAAWFLTAQTAHAPGVTPADGLMGYAYLAALVFAIGVPSLIVLPLVERAESFGRVLVSAVLLGLSGLGATEAFMQAAFHFSPYRYHIDKMRESGPQVIAVYQKAGVPAEVISVVKRWMDFGVSLLPAVVLMYIIIVFVLSLVMFGRLKAWREWVTHRDADASDRGAYLFRNFSLPDWLLFAFIAGGITPLVSGALQKVTANILFVVVFLYLLQGLAIFRSLLVAVGAGFAGVMFGYFILGLLTITGIAPFLLSIAGLFDSFFDFRHFRRKDHSDESHPH